MTLAARGLFLREYAEKGVLPDLDRRILLVKELFHYIYHKHYIVVVNIDKYNLVL